jgi:uncharacterized protein YkwD
MSTATTWVIRVTAVALVLFGATFAQFDRAPGATTAGARTSSVMDASLQAFVRPTRTASATRTTTKTATQTATKTATSTTTTTRTTTATSTSTTVNATDAACLNPQEAAFLADINAYRKDNGLKPLVATKSLNTASYKHSLDMGVNKNFAHTTPGGTTFVQRMAAEGYTYSTIKGENIAAGYSTADAVFTAWKASAGHNANMLNASYTAIGIGFAVVQGSPYVTYWTTDFGGVVDAAPTCN